VTEEDKDKDNLVVVVVVKIKVAVVELVRVKDKAAAKVTALAEENARNPIGTSHTEIGGFSAEEVR